MQLMLYLCSFIVAVMSFIVVYVIVREKKSIIHYVVPIYMDMVVIVALYTEEIVFFGLLGIFGLLPMIKLFAKGRHK